MSFEIVHKPTFTSQLLAIPSKEVPQIIEKVEMLRESPRPDAKNRKRLKGYKHPIYRIRSGNYRILYTYDEANNWVALLGVDHRKDVYDGDELVAEPVDPSVGQLPSSEDLLSLVDTPHDHPKPKAKDIELLPVKIDAELLHQLRIPDDYIPALIGCRTLDDLLAAPVPDQVIERVFVVVSTPDYERVFQQPSFETGAADDLLLFREGKLVDFLLKLDPEQERYVTWALDGSGPTLVKGGPGSGKSTIALYRAKALVEEERKRGNPESRILFTTYTVALVTSSQQLIQRLLGPDAHAVEVRTADSLAMAIVTKVDGKPNLIDRKDLLAALDEAIRNARFEGDALQRRAQVKTIDGMTRDYLLEEIEKVIVARNLSSLEAYLAAPRAGRRVPLTAAQRTAVWRIAESLDRSLHRRNQLTWEQLRRRAVSLVDQGAVPQRYDGIIIDEAQDLDPTLLRLLVSLAKSPDRVFCTADANQSIYGSGFRWTDVHDDLKFRGRTGVLHRIYRSTREIGVAANAYLAGAELDLDSDSSYILTGPIPVIRAVANAEQEADLIVRFLELARKELRLGIGSCAVLVPSEGIGNTVANRLRQRNIPATFMAGRSLDLDQQTVKVLTLRSVKGLEFPIVVIGGLLDGYIPGPGKATPQEEALEQLHLERRAVFVGMTRAMRALLVVTPASSASLLLQGFSTTLWNTGVPA